MTNGIPDLLPENLVQSDTPTTTPGYILEVQASHVGPKTGDRVRAEVERLKPRFDPNRKWTYGYGFNLIAPKLDDYTFQAFQIEYQLANGYPVEIFGAVVDQPMQVHTDDEFIKALRTIFNSPQFLKVVRSLVREATASAPSAG